MAKTGSSLAKLSTQEIQSELRKREGAIKRLEKARQKAFERLNEIDAQLAELGGSAGGVRRRARNDSNLVDALFQVLSGTTMGVTEVAGAVQQAGYRTTSPNFRTIVNQALIKDKRFKRVGRGKYTAKA
jgi:hypothetical protein